jgi:hypothetical protein
MKTIRKLNELIEVNKHLLDRSDSKGLYLLGDSLESWAPASVAGFELDAAARRLLKSGKLVVILDGQFEYCSPTRALIWLKDFDASHS